MSDTTPPRVFQDGSRLSDWIARQLLEDIIAGRIASGERLSEARLASRFAASRAPVRDAFQQLEREGVIEVIPRVGARVQGFSAHDASDFYDLRIALESHAIKRIQPDVRTMAELYELLEQLRGVVRRDNMLQIINSDLALHEAICRLSGNRRLLSTWLSLRGQARALYIFVANRLPVDFKNLAASHEAIIEAIGSGNHEMAAQCLTYHIEGTRVQLTELLTKTPGPEVKLGG